MKLLILALIAATPVLAQIPYNSLKTHTARANFFTKVCKDKAFLDSFLGKAPSAVSDYFGKPTSTKPSDTPHQWSYSFHWYSPGLVFDFDKENKVVSHRCFIKK